MAAAPAAVRDVAAGYPKAMDDCLSNRDLLLLILTHALPDESALHCWDSSRRNGERATLRLLSSLVLGVLDSCVVRMKDAGSPERVARRSLLALARLPNLTEMQLHGLDAAAFATLTAAPSLSRLRLLRLPQGTFEGVDAVWSPWDTLRELDLTGCGMITDSGLESIIGSSPSLVEFRLSVNARLRCPRLRCGRVERATLCICANLQDDAVSYLCEHAPALQATRCRPLHGCMCRRAQTHTQTHRQTHRHTDTHAHRHTRTQTHAHIETGACRLQDLNLWRCASLRKPTLRSASLTQLNLSECVELDDAAVADACADGSEEKAPFSPHVQSAPTGRKKKPPPFSPHVQSAPTGRKKKPPPPFPTCPKTPI